jgi:hypothetical protein
MADEIKSIWPGIYVMVRKQPSELNEPLPDAGIFQSVDAAGSMYYASDGPIDEWIENESSAHDAMGLDTIWVLAISSPSGSTSWVANPVTTSIRTI